MRMSRKYIASASEKLSFFNVCLMVVGAFDFVGVCCCCCFFNLFVYLMQGGGVIVRK